MHDLFWELNQERRIGDLQSDINRSTNQSDTVIRRLEARVDRLALINTALWEITMKRLNISQDELEAKVTEVDVRDGLLDGRIRPDNQPLRCAACDRTLMQRHRTCLYCGQAHAPSTSLAV